MGFRLARCGKIVLLLSLMIQGPRCAVGNRPLQLAAFIDGTMANIKCFIGNTVYGERWLTRFVRSTRAPARGFCPAAGNAIIVMPQKESRGGVTRVRGVEKAFRWELDTSSAEWFAELTDVLAKPSHLRHQSLEHLRSTSDIVVMVSCGEYPDDLLSRYLGR